VLPAAAATSCGVGLRSVIVTTPAYPPKD